MDLASKLFKGDRVIWIIFMFLCLISVVEVFSATSTIAYKNANHWAPIVRHATFLLGGFVLVLLLHNLPCRFFPAFILLLPVSVLMLLVTPLLGSMPTTRTAGWRYSVYSSSLRSLPSWPPLCLSPSCSVSGVVLPTTRYSNTY